MQAATAPDQPDHMGERMSGIIDLDKQDLSPLAEHARKLLAILEEYVAWSQASGYRPGIDAEMFWWDSYQAAARLRDELTRLGFDGTLPVRASSRCRYAMQLYAWLLHHPKVLETPADNPSACPDFAAPLAELRLIVARLSPSEDWEPGRVPGGASGQQRLIFDQATQAVTLDGTTHTIEDAKTFSIYKAIAEAEQYPIRNEDIRQAVKGVQGRHAIRNRLNTLPKALQSTIHTSTAGHTFRLPVTKRKRRTSP
jgi:hypothetical protein